jgi:hypothetical protein
MMNQEYREFCEQQRDFSARQIEWHLKMIAYANATLERIKRELKRTRKDDKELVAHVWAKGVLTKCDWYIFGNPDSFVGVGTKKLISERADAYRSRKKNLAWIEHYKQEVTRYERILGVAQ